MDEAAAAAAGQHNTHTVRYDIIDCSPLSDITCILGRKCKPESSAFLRPTAEILHCVPHCVNHQVLIAKRVPSLKLSRNLPGWNVQLQAGFI